MQYDVIFLQETYITNDKLKEWKLDWNGKLYFVEGTNCKPPKIFTFENNIGHYFLNEL